MPELKSALVCISLIIGAAAAMVLGDYLGYKIGRVRLALFASILALLCVIAFAIYAAIVLL